ncbi:hypothetical protein P168DRAFT_286832 [Aspergillus campestris IBT 28561]|uniref:Uncharacterized protein n=1 Tax=Aspergillus campestris (strain IBT 28561) TaxID=1392248 RepID=A0A2I1DFX2_ASPC2|nr:uncharacterized protein P168DRAFT_286832 [Aspergillus campestris IBT 28561]PKY08760.1 hypothetical protein P168DRAFT_286832 [Aspergillus campestris IBT 28561]
MKSIDGHCQWDDSTSQLMVRIGEHRFNRGTIGLSTQDANGIRVDLRLPRILIVSGTDEKKGWQDGEKNPIQRLNGLELADDPGEFLGKDRDQSRSFGFSAVGYFGHVMCQLTGYLYLIDEF